MRSPHRVSLVCLLALLLCASSAMAGGRGKTEIKIKNNSTGPIAVGVDILNADNLEEFTIAGGRYVNPGASKTFRVHAGEHEVVVVNALLPVFPPTGLTVDVKKKKKTTVLYDGLILTEK